MAYDDRFVQSRFCPEPGLANPSVLNKTKRKRKGRRRAFLRRGSERRTSSRVEGSEGHHLLPHRTRSPKHRNRGDQALRNRNAFLFQLFPDVRPEHVLIKRSLLQKNGAKKRRFVNCPHRLVRQGRSVLPGTGRARGKYMNAAVQTVREVRPALPRTATVMSPACDQLIVYCGSICLS